MAQTLNKILNIKTEPAVLKPFKHYLQVEIIHAIKRSIKSTQASRNAVEGYSSQLADIIISAKKSPKLIQISETHNRFVGYYIYSSRIQSIKRSILFCTLSSFIKRAENSTYHRNNSRSKSNGYSHWYEPQDNFNIVYGNACVKYKNQVEHIFKYKKVQYDMSKLNIALNPPSYDHFRVPLETFLEEFEKWERYESPQFSTVLKYAEDADTTYIYVKNKTKSDKAILNGNGRDYTVLGCLNKALRKRLLSGFTEVDLECGVQSILMNINSMNTLKTHQKNKMNPEFKLMTELLNNKQLFRHKTAAAFGVKLNTAKIILTQLAYAPNSNVIRKYCRTPKQIEKAKKFLVEYKKECSKLRNSAIDKLYYLIDENKSYKFGNLTIGDIPGLIDEEMRVQNNKLAGKGRGRERAARILFRIYELFERQIREAMIEFYNSKSGVEIYQIHDCVIVDCQANTPELINYITQKLNFNVSFSVELY